MDTEDIRNRFTYHPPKDGQAPVYESVRNVGHSFAKVVNQLCPESREKSLAVTHIEQAVMWANASIARHQ